MITKVEEPSEYGVVLTDPEGSGRVDRFVEKSKEFVGNHVNAGIYILNCEVLDRIELRPTSMEQEIFPQMAAEGNLFSMVLPGYWQDVGESKNFLTGMCQHLQYLEDHQALASRPQCVGFVLVCRVEGLTVLGEDVQVKDEKFINGGLVLPHKAILTNIPEPGTIVM
ncbi:Aste57867_10418 [Aphanomyces stellatus]|uniref:Aste57867_10418 protein n=1 Tax=Aphanomyces stellatus TaxID=120398 RepID=A0A485KQE1_9STRA|nr:hypothetical protein As57867_010378 [Aphanomyces stellatus]VFT87292.1 Aste57867_10418 [Aphanomyces stellatus]